MAESLVTVMIENSPPVRTPEGGWSIDIWAIAQRSRGNPKSEETIQFFMNSVPIHEAPTREDGTTLSYKVADIPTSTPAVRIEAQPGKDASRRHGKVVRWEGTAPKPKEVRVFQQRVDEGFLIVALILDTNENPIMGETLHIIDPQDSRFVYPADHPSDKHGMVRVVVPFIQTHKDITLLVRGVEKPVPLDTIPDFDSRDQWDPPTHTDDSIPKWRE